MVAHFVLRVLLAFVATGVSFSFAAPTFKGTEELTLALQYIARTDTDAVLAHRFPHVPREQRGNIGNVPNNLYPLIQGADNRGRLFIPAPQPRHALLLTKSVPDKKPFFGPALLHTKEWNIFGPEHVLTKTGTAGKQTVKGMGAFTDASGRTHYFRTIPFDPAFRQNYQHTRPTESTNYITSRDLDGKLFHPRPITLKLPDGNQFRSKDKVLLPHISVVPQSGLHEGDLRIYPEQILNEVLKGPPQGPISRIKGAPKPFVQWSDTPNWSRKERHAKLDGDGTSSPRWIQKLKSPFSGSNGGGALVRSA